MLHLIYGGDSVARKIKYQKTIDTASSSGAVLVLMDDTDFDFDFLKISSGGSNLFAEKYVVLMSGVLSNKDLNIDVILEMLSELHSSSNIFIFSEQSLIKEIVKKFEKVKTQIVDLGKLENKTKEKFNTFSLTDVFGARDKKMSWIIYERALSKNVPPEEINGVLFWMVKGMMLAHKENRLSISETGLSPFVYQKAKRASENFSMLELKNISKGLVHLYHDAHRGETDFESGIELLLLKSL